MPSAIGHNIQSTLTLLAKDGRFKIRHTNIKYLQKSTGGSSNDGYMSVTKRWGTGWEDVQTELFALSKKVATCIQKKEADNW